MQDCYTKTSSQILAYFKTSPFGLTCNEAKNRLEKQGLNQLESTKKQNLLVKFLKQFCDTMVIILLCASVISLIFALVKQSKTELVDSIIIFIIVLINAILGFSQELKAENALESLKKMSQPYSLVLRNNFPTKIKTSELVVGDVVLLEAGDIVPADIYLLESTSLKCNESNLTGESVSVDKCANIVLPKATHIGDRKNMCFSSTTIEYGKGKGVIIATGKNAEIGKIASLLKDKKVQKTPLQNSLNRLGEIITFIVLAIAIVIFIVDIAFVHIGFVESFLTAVAIAVAAIPESLPAVVTIILSLGVVRLAKKNAIIKKLHAVETLGCCEIICSDKTGTITENKMTITKVCFDTNFISDILDDTTKVQQEMLCCMTLCNNAYVKKNKTIGDATEIALLNFAKKSNYRNKDFVRIDELPFDSIRKLMSVKVKKNETFVQYTKGAFDELLKKCKFICDKNIIRPINSSDIEKLKLRNFEMGKRALRVLGLAYKNLKDNEKIDENNLVFLGLVGMIDPPKKEVFSAIQKCKKAGLKPIMITGDHKDTATAIALELDIIKSPKEVVNGSFLDKFTDKELAREISKYSVFCRVSPEHKVRIVKAYKSLEKVVAMTGDGVNDAPSIKSADIGIGMGKTGTDVTKEVASVILADDNFATIILAVEEGRRIYGNIQKTIQFLLGCNIAEVLAIFSITLLFPTHQFLNAVQILFINLITDTFPAIALGVDTPEKDIMNKPPRNSKKSILSGRTGFDICYQGFFQALIVLCTYIVGFVYFKDYKIATTMAFLTINFIQLFHMYNVHSNKSIFKENPFKNKLINVAFLLEISVFILFALVPPLSKLLDMQSISLIQWTIVFGMSMLIIPICEIAKVVENKNQNKKLQKG
jgi:P-type Ca2+ transporter type 2C